MLSPVDVPVVDGPLPSGDPRSWLTAVVLEGERPVLTRVVAQHRGRRRVAVDPKPDAAWMAAVDEALLEDGADWVGGYGTALMKHGGKRLLTSFARIRWPDGTVWLRTWVCVPGMPLVEEAADTYEGRRDMVPDWLQRLFPKPRGLPVVIRVHPWSDRDWLERYGVRAPDHQRALDDVVQIEGFASSAARYLESEVVGSGRVRAACVAWLPEGLAVWWEADTLSVQALGVRLARDPAARVRAAGMFGRGMASETADPMLGLVVESADGARVLWARRYAPHGDTVRWMEPAGRLFHTGPALGWFDP